MNSTIATAAVHAGILGNGESGVIKLTLTGNQTFAASTQNGISSSAFTFAQPGFGMERVISRSHRSRRER
ncbi:hypothetical protein HZ994_03615 [Akkermansiaceae bacterium]|nr:hypothetical protein HZ994_03615 [Akkermansiaceae bacterium]